MPPVKLDLLFTGSAAAHGTGGPGLPAQLGVHALEARQQILELRALDLEGGFPGAGTIRENAQDETGAVEKLCLQQAVEIPHLDRGEGAVEEHQFRLLRKDGFPDFFDLPASDQGAGDAGWEILGESLRHFDLCGFRKSRHLPQGFLESGIIVHIESDEDGFLHNILLIG